MSHHKNVLCEDDVDAVSVERSEGGIEGQEIITITLWKDGDVLHTILAHMSKRSTLQVEDGVFFLVPDRETLLEIDHQRWLNNAMNNHHS